MMSNSKLPEFTLHHGAISVSNLEQSIAFYGLLGFAVDSRTVTPDGQLEIVHLRNRNAYMELFAHKDWRPLPEHARDNLSDFPVVGTKHIAFATNEPEGFHRYLQQMNVSGLTEIFSNNPRYKYFFFRDPDGIAIEVVTPVNSSHFPDAVRYACP